MEDEDIAPSHIQLIQSVYGQKVVHVGYTLLEYCARLSAHTDWISCHRYVCMYLAQ